MDIRNRLLVDVMNTDDKGLIGFTQNGEEVALGPHPKRHTINEDIDKAVLSEISDVVDFDLGKFMRYLNSKIQYKIKEILEKNKTSYILQKEPSLLGQLLCVPYALYTKRK